MLQCFRPGANTWLSGILPRRIDRLLFAATKADHLHHTSHDRLEAILRLIADKAIARAAFAGAEVKVMALAALRATREAEAKPGRQRLPCIVGVPLPGERLGGKVFDGKAEAAVFPGDLPEDPASLTTQPAVAGRADAQRPFPALPAAAREPREPLRRGAGPAAHPARPGHRVPAGGPPRMSAAVRTAPAARVRSRPIPAIVEEPLAPRAGGRRRRGCRTDGGRPAASSRPTLADLGQRGLRWGTLLVSALAGAAALGAARLVRAPRLRGAGARGLGRLDHARAAAGGRASPR